MVKPAFVTGTIVLHEMPLDAMKRQTVATPFGDAVLFISDSAIHLPRHGCERTTHIPPHRINHRANMAALKEQGASWVVGVNSTGSLKKNLKPGMVVIPHDFISLTATPTVFEGESRHVVPLLDETLRKRLAEAAVRCGGSEAVATSGIYWQTAGPRFETKAEIAMMSSFADIVGMTMADEAVACCELGLPYASVCSVDNFAHGIGHEPLSADVVRTRARTQGRTVAEILTALLP